ncbi:MAG: hypothetical protein AAGB93_06545 [Planctomycetota bacterium]
MAHLLSGSVILETATGDVRRVYESDASRETIRDAIAVAHEGTLASAFVTVRLGSWGQTRLLVARGNALVPVPMPTAESATVHDVRLDATRTSCEALISTGPRSSLGLLRVPVPHASPRDGDHPSGPPSTLEDLGLSSAWSAAFLGTSDEIVAVTGPAIGFSRLWSDPEAMRETVHPTLNLCRIGDEWEPEHGYSLATEWEALDCLGLTVSACRMPAEDASSDRADWLAVIGVPRRHGQRGEALLVRKAPGAESLDVTPLTHIAELAPGRFMLDPERFGLNVEIVGPQRDGPAGGLCLVGTAPATLSTGVVVYSFDGEHLGSVLEEQLVGNVHSFGFARGSVQVLGNDGLKAMAIERMGAASK